MSKLMKTNQLPARRSVRVVVLACMLSIAAAGCTTNQSLTSGDPISMSPTGGPLVPTSSRTPGSAGSTIPATMISAAVDRSVDAAAVLEANRSFEGRVLGPASPADGAAATQLQSTGRVTPDAAVPNVANFNTAPSISTTADGRPMVFRGVDVVPTGGLAAAATSGVTGLSTTTATGIAGATVAPIAPLAATRLSAGVTGLSTTTATGIAGATVAPSAPLAATGISAGVTIPATNATTAGSAATTATPAATANATTPTLTTIASAPATAAVAATRARSSVRVETTSGRVVVTNQSSANP